jgi:hypothetical protein
MRGQTVPKPVGSRGNQAQAKPTTATTKGRVQGNPKEVALESTLKRAETKQLESFIHNRSKELDSEIEKMRQKLHTPGTSTSKRVGGSADDDLGRGTDARHAENKWEEESEDDWRVRGRGVTPGSLSRSPERERKANEDELRRRRRMDQLDDELMHREVKQAKGGGRYEGGKYESGRYGEGTGDDSDLEEMPRRTRADTGTGKGGEMQGSRQVGGRDGTGAMSAVMPQGGRSAYTGNINSNINPTPTIQLPPLLLPMPLLPLPLLPLPIPAPNSPTSYPAYRTVWSPLETLPK